MLTGVVVAGGLAWSASWVAGGCWVGADWQQQTQGVAGQGLERLGALALAWAWALALVAVGVRQHWQPWAEQP